MRNPTPDLTGVPVHEHPGHILDLLDLPGRRGAAVVDFEGALTYEELDARSSAIAARLLELGVVAGEPVVVHTRLSRWAVVAMLGVLRAGARYVPVDAGFPTARKKYMMSACAARFAVEEPGLDEVATGPARVSAFTEGPPVEEIHGALAYTCFTSGSTGSPKQVTVSAAALAYSTACRMQYYPTPVSAFLLCSSISFDSSVAGIYWTLACGGRLIIPSDRPSDVLALGRAAREHRASHVLILPSFYDIALRADLADRLATLSTVIVAGETCPPDLIRAHYKYLPGARMYNEYGPTECTVWSTVHECAQEDADLPDVPIGRPIPGTRLYVRSADGASVPRGDMGELHIAGPGLADSLPASEYRTGDLVSVTDDGALRYHGRADRQLKLGGVRIERGEIEQALRGHGAVAAAGVGVSRVGGRLRPVGFVVPVGDGVDQRELRVHLLASLPSVAVPNRIDELAELPTLPNGKLDHYALDELAQRAVARIPVPDEEP